MDQTKREQVIPDEMQSPDADPVLGFARVIRYRSESLGGLRIKL